jgi:hypothetical protein
MVLGRCNSHQAQRRARAGCSVAGTPQPTGWDAWPWSDLSMLEILGYVVLAVAFVAFVFAVRKGFDE